MSAEASIKYLKDYTPPDYLVETVALRFELGARDTLVTAQLSLTRNEAGGPHRRPLVLDGQQLDLQGVKLNGEVLDGASYSVDDEHLTLSDVPAQFNLEVKTRIHPADNTSLEGLYQSSGNFCTQCEAEGFRKITYFPDRPDVMARYTTTVVADRAECPVMLSNGNAAERGELDGNRHWVTWEDPFPKPSYLFALVAGDLACLEDRYTTRSGREVRLEIFVEKHNIDKCEHAMHSLQKAMRWDEEVFGLEYDLDSYMIVAVDDFNMGAMENKGLNVFNSKYVLARPDTATDHDYAGIEGVIAHEYFHNWTGNRVTCRDWFQLSLKEGLTVFRDQEFSCDMQSRAAQRIQDVRTLRASQFPEDSGPMAHPVRPDSYLEISNFYTATVYQKGAEVIRMMHTLLGKEGFRKGMDLYFERHDGQAVTTGDFAQAMQDASGIDLAQFKRWYDQAGTPEVSARGEYDDNSNTYALTLKQACPPTPGQSEKAPFHIPIRLGLLDGRGAPMPLTLRGDNEPSGGTERVVSLGSQEQRFEFVDLPEAPVPSLVRGFSAPVKLKMERSDDELAFLLAHDDDPFNRWEAGQELATTLLLRLVAEHQAGRELTLEPMLVDAFASTLKDSRIEPALIAETLTLPSEGYLAERMSPIDVVAIHTARQFMRRSVAAALEDTFTSTYQANTSHGAYAFGAEAAGRRRLKNVCLAYLMALEDAANRALCMRQFDQGDNMTDVLAALGALANTACEERAQALEAFHDRWRNETLVLDKWFSLQATSHLPNTLDEVKRLMRHPAFTIKNPNKVRALIGAFCHGNPVRFHDKSGEGYRFLADQVLELDPLNPQIAARLLGAFSRWRKFDHDRQVLMKSQLEKVLAAPKLSRDSFEIASKTLA